MLALYSVPTWVPLAPPSIPLLFFPLPPPPPPPPTHTHPVAHVKVTTPKHQLVHQTWHMLKKKFARFY